MKTKNWHILILLNIISVLLFAQDSAIALQDSIFFKDSVLESSQAISNQLLNKLDSTKMADSLAQLMLTQKLAELKENDAKAKAKIQAQLDSLEKEKNNRNLRIQAQVDSLRASTKGVPVVLGNDTLFKIYSKVGPFGPVERAISISKKLELLVEEGAFNADKLIVFAGEETHDIMHGEVIILSISNRDSFWYNQSRELVAKDFVTQIIRSVDLYKSQRSIIQTIKRISLLIIVLLIFILSIRWLNKGFTKFNIWIVNKLKPYMGGLKFKNYDLISKEREAQITAWLLKTIKWIAILIILYLLLPIVFSIFPTTKGIASKLIGYVIDPFISIVKSLVGYIPEMLTIAVIVYVTRAFVNFLEFLASEIETQKLVLTGFYPDWAKPTFQLLKIVIYAFAFIVIFPYLPGSDSPAFQGVSVFLGLLISLGSSSAIGNIIAGLVITYMRAFKLGDRVKIGETTGDVIEKTMLVTRLRTIKNEDVTIPNSAILNGSTVNYSSSAQDKGLILHTTVTIGYDVPWTQVHSLLKTAAFNAEFVLKTPEPFILQTSLDDFYVSYQLNAYTKEAHKAAKIYSNIHSNIQDEFNKAGVEILSPHYRAARDGNMVTIPSEYLPADYQAPSFNVKVEKNEK